MTKEELQEYKYLEKEIQQLEEEEMRLRDRLENPSTQKLTGMPKGSSYYDRTADLVVKLVDLCNEISERKGQLISERKRIEAAIGALDSGDRLLIRYRYVTGLGWEEIAMQMGYTFQHLHRLHKRILEKL